MHKQDVIVIGAGGGGAVVAKELGELGVNVLVLEAGPWYGNKKWPRPNIEKGGVYSKRADDLDIRLFKESYNKLENNMNDQIGGTLRWGPANRAHPPWNRSYQQRGFAWQNSGVGGTTQHYLANSPRAFPSSFEREWPISYRELVPFYEKVEAELPVEFAPTTSKEELFYFAVKKAGWKLLPTLNVESPGYRPQPNAILPPNKNLLNPVYSNKELSWMEGCTLAGHCRNGCPHGPSVAKVAKRSTNVSYVPLALSTGNVEIRPNTFTYKVITENHPSEGLKATGVKVRNTWTGEKDELFADCIVLAAGAIETPRLWLNSSLPYNQWAGRGLVNHNMDMVTGVFNERNLLQILKSPGLNPFTGHTSGARLDLPGLGSIQIIGTSPGLMASFTYAISKAETIGPLYYNMYTSYHKGRVSGRELIERMADYQRSLNILIVTDDEVDSKNRTSVLPSVVDDHGAIPSIRYTPTYTSQKKKMKLVKLASTILFQGGAKRVIHSNWPSGMLIHIMSTMRMGYVVDQNCEAFQVSRLFISDNSVLTNGLGGVNPTLTTQAVATRTAEKIFQKYFYDDKST